MRNLWVSACCVSTHQALNSVCRRERSALIRQTPSAGSRTAREHRGWSTCFAGSSKSARVGCREPSSFRRFLGTVRALVVVGSQDGVVALNRAVERGAG